MLKTKNVVITLSVEDYDLLQSLSADGSAEKYVETLIDRELTARRLEKGYTEMAEINLELAQEGSYADEEGARVYEEELKKNS